MNVLLAGATGETGQELIRSLSDAGHHVRALVRPGSEHKLASCVSQLQELRLGDVTKPASLRGVCAGIEAVITLVTRTLARERHLQVDVTGNSNLLREAEGSGVRRFVFVSSLGAGTVPGVPVLEAKGLFEAQLRGSALSWLIVRPSALFQDMERIFSMAGGRRVVLFGNGRQRVTPMSERDLADFITARLSGPSECVDIGGPETFTMDEIARMALRANGKPERVLHLPLWLFSGIVALVKIFSPDSYPVMRFVQHVFGSSNEAPIAGRIKLAEHFRDLSANAGAAAAPGDVRRLFRR
jgi:uncharacterized protein YbjT (DUF2867 family)